MYLTVSGSTAHNALDLLQLDLLQLLQLHLFLSADISSHLCLISLLLRSCGGQKRRFQSKVHYFDIQLKTILPVFSLLALLPFNSAQVEVRDMGPSDYQLGTSFTKEFSLIGRDNKTEKLMVMQKSSLFNKDFKVV